MRFIATAMRRGYVVSRPDGDSAHYDPLVDAHGRLNRVQVKSVRVERRNAYRISCGRGLRYKYSYSTGESDLIVAYVILQDTWYIIPVREIYPRKTIHLCRTSQARAVWNNIARLENDWPARRIPLRNRSRHPARRPPQK